jgi:hypothetical protein
MMDSLVPRHTSHVSAIFRNNKISFINFGKSKKEKEFKVVYKWSIGKENG